VPFIHSLLQEKYLYSFFTLIIYKQCISFDDCSTDNSITDFGLFEHALE